MMAEIRCPMCGKPNSSDREVCQFCDARLVPLIADTPPEEEQTPLPAGPSYPEMETSPEAESSEQEESSSDWLTDLRQEEEEVQAPSVRSADDRARSAASSFEEEEVVDWLSRLEGQPEEGSDDDEALSKFEDDQASDWISRLEEQPEEQQEEGEPRFEQAPAEFEWSDEETLEEVKSPDWVNDMQGETGEAFEELSEADLPEWLQQIRQGEEESPSEQELTPPEEVFDSEAVEAVESIEQDLDWLEGAEQESEPERESEDLPDWLSQAASQEETNSEEPADEIPDWLTELPEESVLEPIGMPQQVDEEIEEEPSSEEDLIVPDWLSEIEVQAERSPESEAAEERFEIEEEGEEAFELGELRSEDERAVPDWMTEMGAGAGFNQEIEPLDEPLELEGDEWKEQVGEDFQEEPVPFEEEAQEDIYLADLPSEWLPGEVLEDQPIAGEEPEPEISRAEIPSWLASMRPVEDAAPSLPQEEEEQKVESAGPLAGLSGVLSSQPEIARAQKPPTYSVKLHFTENQNAHAELLRNLLADEGQPQSIARPAMISPQHILRAAIGLALIFAVLWQIFTGSQQAPLPTFAMETAAVNRLVSQLPDQARVLISFDYEPGMTGEMDAAASAVVDHLMLRGAYLTLVSTSPMGPIVAERFLATTQSQHNYTSREQYVNLGFVPGGPAGLLGFAEAPHRVLPYTLDGNLAWQADLPPLQGINRLVDYSLVLVVTDNPNVARTWVEQVGPYLETEERQAPLVMVTSAQAEPLVRPYYQGTTGQVQGLVSGLRGGGAYALLTGRGGLPRKYWDAFSFGLWTAGALITIGGLINIALIVLERTKRS